MLRKLSLAVLSISIALLCAAAIQLLTGSSRFETNILALLPAIHRDRVVEAALHAHTHSMSRHVAIVIRAANQGAAEHAASNVANLMRSSGMFENIREKISLESLKAVEGQLYDHPFQLVEPPPAVDGTSATRALLDSARAHAFSTEGMQWLRGITEDPLIRLPEYLQQIRTATGNYSVHNGYIHVDQLGASNVLLTAALTHSGLTGGSHRSVTKFFEDLQLPSGVSIIPAGVVFFAEDAAARTEMEISLITGMTALLVTAVLWWVFRTPRAVIVTSAVMFISFLVTLIASHWVWFSITGSGLHLITIGFGSSLIGVSSDYALHYFVAHYSTTDTDRSGPLGRVRAGLLFGFATTVVGFLGIALSPFPGLQQLALFSIFGLLVSLILVLIWVPRVAGRPTTDTRLVKLAGCAEIVHSRRLYITLGLFCAVIASVGLPRITVQDDIRILSTPPPELVARQRQVGTLTGLGDGGTIALVSAANDEQLLEREELLRMRLDSLVASGRLKGYRALSQLAPSQSMQKRRYALTAKTLNDNPDETRRFIQDLHLPETSIAKLASLTTNPPTHYVTLQSCIQSHACDAVRDLYLGILAESTVASIVPLNGFQGDSTIILAGIPGVTPLNHADAISSALARYREIAMTYTGLVYVAVVVLLVWRYGIHHALRTLAPPTVGGATALAALALCGVPINVFSVFALLVLIGLSIDYAIFCAEDFASATYTNFAVLLSAITTAISFGLLSFSSTPALRSFGIVLSVGVIVAALVAPVATPSPPTQGRSSGLRRLLLTIVLIASGCTIALPAPAISTEVVADTDMFVRLCPTASHRAQILLDRSGARIAALECSNNTGVIVLLNSYGLRVQTITLRRDGELRNEASYLAKDPLDAELIVRKFTAP